MPVTVGNTRWVLAVGLVAATAIGPAAYAVPITTDYAGYWLDTVGSNSIGIAGGGSPAGTTRALFVAATTPGGDQGTTATANFGGVATSAPTYGSATREWVRSVVNPSAAQLAPLSVDFANGPDTASFAGRSLVGLTPLPLVTGLTVDTSVDPYGPLVSWTLPATSGWDRVQLVFYNDDTNAEIGTRVLLPADATSYDINGPIPFGLPVVINVRLVDLFDPALPFEVSNQQRISRTYINYTAPVPEPSGWALMTLGVAGLAGWLRARRRGGGSVS